MIPRRELALALVCSGLLMLEVCLTKVFSIVLWYHFGFLAVSTALLGFASSGVFLALRDEKLTPKEADKGIGRAASAAALMTLVSLWLVTQTTFDVYTVVADRTIGTLLAFVLWVTLPFFFLGMAISRALASFPERVGTLYGADLIGSAIGCGLALGVLTAGFSGQVAIVTAAGLIAVGGLLFAGVRLTTLLALAAPVALLATLDLEEHFPLRSPASKPYYKVESIDASLATKGLPPLRRGVVTLTSGELLEVEVTEPPTLTADGTAVLVETDDGPRRLPLVDIAEKADGSGLAFERRPWSPYRRWSSLSRVDAFHWPGTYESWGLWGLSDRHKADGVELPRQKGITIDAWAMTSIMRYSGDPLYPPGTPEVDAAREPMRTLEYLPAGTVHRVKPEADHIVCIGAGGGLDLLTAKYFGAKRVTGVEINPGVYTATKEAFPEFAGRLYDPEVHPDVDVHVAEGRHFLERSKDTYDIVQLSGVDTFSTTQAGAFSLSENNLYTLEAFDTFLGKLNPGGVLTLTRWFYPHVEVLKDESGKVVDRRLHPRASLRLMALAREALWREGLDQVGKRIFFLNSGIFTVILVKPDGFTPEELGTLHSHCEQYGYEVLWSPRQTPERIRDAAGNSYPNPIREYMHSKDPQQYIAAQKFDVSPPSDDRPFFFEVSRFEQILDLEHFTNPLGGLTAHGILVLLLLEMVLLGAVFVLWPLRVLSKRDRSPGAGRVRLGALIYFTAIGFGFIVVEIVLSQKFVLFLGHPVYALAVILFSMLLFSGIGSLISSRFPVPAIATLLAGGIALVPALLFERVFDTFLAEDLWVRIAVSVGILAPLALVMGIPFPSGVRLLDRVQPRLITWGWAINGYTSVIGSVLAVMLGIELGFMTTLFIAAGVYVFGVVGYLLMRSGTTRADYGQDGGVAADEASFDTDDFDDEEFDPEGDELAPANG